MKSTLKQNKNEKISINLSQTSYKIPTYIFVIGLCNKKKRKDRVICILYTCISARNHKHPHHGYTTPQINYIMWMERSKNKKAGEEVVTKRSESNMNNWLLELYGLTTKMMKI